MRKPMPELRMNSNEFFGGDVAPEVRRQIELAKQAPPHLISERLWAIQTRAPESLPIYYLLYKLHASRRELERAERAALLGLAQAGRQCGLPGDIRFATSVPAGAADFMSNGPARFWLFTLKALAFIRMRSGRADQARRLLECIGRCDPSHSVGTDVIAALLQASSD
jgi:hypothetical protein